MTPTADADEAVLEREVRETQDEIGETVQKLEQKLEPKEIVRSAVGDRNFDLGREAIEVVKHNPVPAALIAVGVIWLLATSNSPTINEVRRRLAGRGSSKK